MTFWNNHLPFRIRRIWRESVSFHGKACSTLALGVRVCDTALSKLGLKEPGDSRLICVSEYDGCCVDAIQIGLRCTAGKKHLLYYKTGKLIFTVYDLNSGKSVRVCTKADISKRLPTMKAAQLLSMPEEQLFYFEEAHPMTPRVEAKVRRACNAAAEGIPPRDSGVQDSPDQFRKFDLPK